MPETYRRIQRPTPPAPTQTLNLVEFRSELRVQVQKAMAAEPNTVTVLSPPPGAQKTIITAEEVAALPGGSKVIVYAQTHDLAREEWERRILGSLRLMSLSHMADEGLLTAEVDGAETKIDCPFQKEIASLQAKSVPYFASHCLQRCPHGGNCEYHRRKRQAKETDVLVCPHAYLPVMSGTGLMDDRLIIIDECAAPYLHSKVEFTEQTIGSFRTTLDEFQASGEADGKVLAAVRQVLTEIQSVPIGESRTMNDPDGTLYLNKSFQPRFNKFISENSAGANLLPAVRDVAIHRRFVRCSQQGDSQVWWTIRPNLPSNSRPILILDATGSRELYETVFPGRHVVVWPDAVRYTPKSVVTQFSDGTYPQASLWNTTVDPPKPSGGFASILDHVEKTIAYHKTDMASVGIVTLNKLTDAVHAKFPAIPRDNVLHYCDLRGRNSIRTCSLVFVLGCQPPSLLGVAEAAVVMFGLDAEPASLVGDLDAQRRFEAVDAASGGFEVQRFAFRNTHMKLAWEALVTAEVIQAVGRSRVHDDRDATQRVFVFTSLDIGMPATRVLTRAEHLKEMGYAANKADGLSEAIRNLTSQGKPFGYKDIAVLSGIELRNLKAPRYQQVIKRTVAELSITVSGKPAKFGTAKENPQ